MARKRRIHYTETDKAGVFNAIFYIGDIEGKSIMTIAW